jgi:hypothetical protein
MSPEFRRSVDHFKAMNQDAQARALSSIDAKLAELTSLRAALRRAQKEAKRTCPVPVSVDVL